MIRTKYFFLTLATLAILSAQALASVSRLAVLGTQPTLSTGSEAAFTPIVNGSLWYDDNYNMFYNPSVILDFANYVTFHKGNHTSGNNGGEAGWVSRLGNQFAYGLYFNRGGSAYDDNYTTARVQGPGLNTATNQVFAGNNNTLNTRRPIDLLFAGDTAGIKWGAKLTWAYNRNQGIATAAQDDLQAVAQYWHLGVGAQYNGFEPFAGTTFATKFERNNTEPTLAAKDELDAMQVGLRYRYGAWTPYVIYNQHRRSGNGPGINDPTSTTGDTQVQAAIRAYGIGVGHKAKIVNGVDLLSNIGFHYSVTHDTTNTTFTNRDMKQMILPLNLAVEADATSWLTLRAGLEYYFWNEMKFGSLGTSLATAPTAPTNKNQSFNVTSSARIGSTFKFRNLELETAFGSGGAGNQTDNSQTVGFDSNTFVMATATYRWK